MKKKSIIRDNFRFCIKIAVAQPEFTKVNSSIKGFAALKRKLFYRLKAYNVKIPTRSLNDKTLLETLLEQKDVPEKLKKEIKKLIVIREQIIPFLVPVLQKIAKKFLAIKLDKNLSQVDNIIHITEFETALAKAARQGLDRIDPVNPNFRFDFIFSAMKRILPEIFLKSNIDHISIL